MRSLTYIRRCTPLFVAIFLSALPADGQENPLPAPLDFTFGMVGLAPGQTARLNVVNIGSPSGSTIPCGLVLEFRDDSGRALTQKFVQVDSGKAAFLDLPASGDDERMQVRGIGFNPLLIPVSLSCQLLPTLEVFNTDTGASSVILTTAVRLNGPVAATPGAP